jgi:hypothetical protein
LSLRIRRSQSSRCPLLISLGKNRLTSMTYHK